MSQVQYEDETHDLRDERTTVGGLFGFVNARILSVDLSLMQSFKYQRFRKQRTEFTGIACTCNSGGQLTF